MTRDNVIYKLERIVHPFDDGLDLEVFDFPALADFVLAGTAISGVPVVWVYNRHMRGIVVRTGHADTVYIARQGLCYAPTRSGNLRAQRFAALYESAVIDDRWRIDLRSPLGRAFMETT